MISKKELKDYEIKTIEEFYNIILESNINGNYAQTKNYIKKLSDEQFYLFLNYIKDQTEDNNTFLKMRLIK